MIVRLSSGEKKILSVTILELAPRRRLRSRPPKPKGRDLHSPEYEAWRTAVYRRDGYRCTRCGKASGLEAHHIVPWRSSVTRRFDLDNGVTLCEDCHDVVDRWAARLRERPQSSG